MRRPPVSSVKTLSSLFILISFSLILLALPMPASGETLIIGGSGSNLDAMRVLAEKFHKLHPDIDITVPTSLGSTGAVQAVLDGGISIGLLSRPLKEGEKKKVLAVLPYAITPVVIGVHSDVPDDGITIEELVQIYEGKKTRWKNGKEIIVLSRQPNDSGLAILEEKIPGFKDAYLKGSKEKSWLVLYTDQDMNNALARIPDAVGFTDAGSVMASHLNIKILELDDVFPSFANASKGEYPYLKVLSFLFRKDKLTPGGRAFMDFVVGKKGMKILKEFGCLPPR